MKNTNSNYSVDFEDYVSRKTVLHMLLSYFMDKDPKKAIINKYDFEELPTKDKRRRTLW